MSGSERTIEATVLIEYFHLSTIHPIWWRRNQINCQNKVIAIWSLIVLVCGGRLGVWCGVVWCSDSPSIRLQRIVWICKVGCQQFTLVFRPAYSTSIFLLLSICRLCIFHCYSILISYTTHPPGQESFSTVSSHSLILLVGWVSIDVHIQLLTCRLQWYTEWWRERGGQVWKWGAGGMAWEGVSMWGQQQKGERETCSWFLSINTYTYGVP